MSWWIDGETKEANQLQNVINYFATTRTEKLLKVLTAEEQIQNKCRRPCGRRGRRLRGWRRAALGGQRKRLRALYCGKLKRCWCPSRAP